MWRDTLRDLQWRRRRFIIAIVGTSLVLGMTLLSAGVAQSFRDEVGRTLDAMNIDAWVVKEGAAGSFNTLIPQSEAARVAAVPGVREADAMLYFPEPIALKDEVVDTNLFGHRPGGVGTPPLKRGRAISGHGEAVVDEGLGLELGSKFNVGRESFTVVGLTSKLTLFAGTSNMYIAITDMQRAVFNGLPVATAVAVRGKLTAVPDGLQAQSVESTMHDNLLRPLRNAIRATDLVALFLWFVAACIVGAVVYLSALERGRDFAVFKATGMSSWQLLGGLTIESLIISVLAAALSAGLANLAAPGLPLNVAIPLRAYGLLAGVAVIIGLVASAFGVRRTSAIDPALAFGGP